MRNRETLHLVDFDGTLSRTTPNKSHVVFGKPNIELIDYLTQKQAQGQTIAITTMGNIPIARIQFLEKILETNPEEEIDSFCTSFDAYFDRISSTDLRASAFFTFLKENELLKNDYILSKDYNFSPRHDFTRDNYSFFPEFKKNERPKIQDIRFQRNSSKTRAATKINLTDLIDASKIQQFLVNCQKELDFLKSIHIFTCIKKGNYKKELSKTEPSEALATLSNGVEPTSETSLKSLLTDQDVNEVRVYGNDDWDAAFCDKIGAIFEENPQPPKITLIDASVTGKWDCFDTEFRKIVTKPKKKVDKTFSALKQQEEQEAALLSKAEAAASQAEGFIKPEELASKGCLSALWQCLFPRKTKTRSGSGSSENSSLPSL